MAFRFNFGSNESPSNIAADEKMNERKASRHFLNVEKPTQASDEHFRKYMLDDKKLYYLDPDAVSEQVQSDGKLPCLSSSDLQSGEYEGGFKVWECTYDLLIYLKNSASLLTGKNVLDLGCGAGLLGLFSCFYQPKFVCWQDYNDEVIENFTIPSVERTLQEANIPLILSEQCAFISGDWNNVSSHLTERNFPKFNVILSSETIYNVGYYPKLLRVLQDHLHERGMALFAAKTLYFGVGGGTNDFTAYVKNNGNFQVDVVQIFSDGVKREILKIYKK